MKKIILVILLFIPFIVLADSAKLVSIVPRCAYISSKKLVVPVEIISQNEGIIDKTLTRYTIGKVYNDNVVIRIKDISDKNYTISIDGLKDSNNYSEVSFVVNKNRNYKQYDKVLSFNIELLFEEDIPNKIYVLGTEVLLNKDKEVCYKINQYNSKDINSKVVYLNENNYPYIMIIGILVIVIVILGKRRNKDALYKNKNK